MEPTATVPFPLLNLCLPSLPPSLSCCSSLLTFYTTSYMFKTRCAQHPEKWDTAEVLGPRVKSERPLSLSSEHPGCQLIVFAQPRAITLLVPGLPHHSGGKCMFPHMCPGSSICLLKLTSPCSPVPHQRKLDQVPLQTYFLPLCLASTIFCLEHSSLPFLVFKWTLIAESHTDSCLFKVFFESYSLPGSISIFSVFFSWHFWSNFLTALTFWHQTWHR